LIATLTGFSERAYPAALIVMGTRKLQELFHQFDAESAACSPRKGIESTAANRAADGEKMTADKNSKTMSKKGKIRIRLFTFHPLSFSVIPLLFPNN
jgi:hypothetical protein